MSIENLYKNAICEWYKEYLFEYRCCPDQYFSGLTKDKHTLKWSFSLEKISDVTRSDVNYEKINSQNKNVVIVLLESPHTMEFIGVVGPAKGTTGQQIIKCLPSILNGDSITVLDGKGASHNITFTTNEFVKVINDVDLIVMNRIQYQTSLGIEPISPTKVRNIIFQKLWSNFEVKLSLYNRLKSIIDHYEKVIILDACTSDIREVTKETDVIIYPKTEHNSGSIYAMSLKHPSSWHSYSGWNDINSFEIMSPPTKPIDLSEGTVQGGN